MFDFDIEEESDSSQEYQDIYAYSKNKLNLNGFFNAVLHILGYNIQEQYVTVNLGYYSIEFYFLDLIPEGAHITKIILLHHIENQVIFEFRVYYRYVGEKSNQ